MKNIIYYFLLITFISSCNSDDDMKDRAYYHFEDTDYDKIISYNTNQILEFRNENNEVLSFEVINNTLDFKTTNYAYNAGLWSSDPKKTFDFDKKIIELVPSENPYSNDNLRIAFKRFPIDWSTAEENEFKKYPSRFIAFLDDFPFWNKNNGSNAVGGTAIINYSNATTQMEINNFIYENVYTLSSNNPTIENGGQDVNIIYYDKYYGIIGFDDLNDLHWRLSQ